ncbi:MAG: pyruvoyl-dependent arginine decarboxylase, partial [Candidatus Woesearchaeota archaeon]
PKDSNTYGYLSEHHQYGHSSKVAGDYAEDLAATMLASTLGIQFDVNTDWDERKKLFRMGGHFLRASNMTQGARADKNGRWTTAIAAAVFVNDNGDS